MLLLTTALALAPNLSPSLDASPLSAFLATPESHNEARDGANLSYSYVELGAAQYDVDNIDEEADVYYGRASVSLLEFLHVFGEYANQSFDIPSGDVDTDLITVGAGAHFTVMPRLSLYGEIGWLFTDSDFDDDSGYVIDGGARFMALPWDGGGLEINGEVGQYGLDNYGSDDDPIYFEVGARVHFLNAFSIGAAYQMIEDDSQVLGNVRFSF